MSGMYSDLSVIWWLVPAALVMGLFFVWMFIKSVKSGQYEDLETPAVRILFDSEEVKVTAVKVTGEENAKSRKI
jgi:cbb3-type cytochrome oxidase maturation protein